MHSKIIQTIFTGAYSLPSYLQVKTLLHKSRIRILQYYIILCNHIFQQTSRFHFSIQNIMEAHLCNKIIIFFFFHNPDIAWDKKSLHKLAILINYNYEINVNFRLKIASGKKVWILSFFTISRKWRAITVNPVAETSFHRILNLFGG